MTIKVTGGWRGGVQGNHLWLVEGTVQVDVGPVETERIKMHVLTKDWSREQIEEAIRGWWVTDGPEGDLVSVSLDRVEFLGPVVEGR